MTKFAKNRKLDATMYVHVHEFDVSQSVNQSIEKCDSLDYTHLW